MGFFSYFLENKKINTELQHLRVQMTDILSGVEMSNQTYKGSKYGCYEDMVAQISLMYDGKAQWGNAIAKNLIDLRSAFIVGGGVIVSAKEDPKLAERELEYIQDFFEDNNLDQEAVQDWAKEAEIEGKFLCRLFSELKDQRIEARFIPYTKTKYKVITQPGDYAQYERVEYRQNNSDQPVVLESNDFIYKKFGGRTHVVNETPSKVAMILDYLEGLDKALWDWRKINKLFASPTPTFKCATDSEAKALNEMLKKINWKIGKFIATTADYRLVGSDTAAKESILSEIITLIKLISGATGVPVHFLGMPDLMSNRATAHEMGDLMNAATDKERKIWIGAYNELIQKVLRKANRDFKKGFNENALQATVPYMTEAKMREIVDIWLPLYSSNVIDDEIILGKIPGVDIETMMQRKREDSAKLITELRARETARKAEEEDEDQ